jgi:hypothetical protein
MPIGSDRTLLSNYDRGNPSFPASFKAPWAIAIDAGGLDDTADLSTPFVPVTQIATTSRHKVRIDDYEFTLLVTSAFYDAAATTPAGGTFRVFGRFNDGSTATQEAYRALKNRAGNLTRTPPFDATNDSSDGTLKYTTVDLLEDVWDTLGCNEFLIGTTAAHTVATGSAALAGLSVKGI